MYGGAHDVAIAGMADGELLEQVRRDLRSTLGIWTEPRFIHIQRWPQAIEQYVKGHAARVTNIEARLGGIDGVFAVGAALHGVSVPDVLTSSREAGAHIAARLPVRG
jgi:oxygen-dependent protoporphyrinogen oxidase